jgi:hypothetical protein
MKKSSIMMTAVLMFAATGLLAQTYTVTYSKKVVLAGNETNLTKLITLRAATPASSFAYTFPDKPGTTGKVLTTNTNGDLSWVDPNSGVTSLTNNASALLTLSASTGDIDIGLGSQSMNTFFAAPNGSGGAPTFRSILAADLPAPGGDVSGTYASMSVTKVNGSSWPSNAAGFLKNDGSGGLTWEAAGGGSVTGSGTSGTITKWTGTSAIGNSTITDNGSTVATTVDLKINGADKKLIFLENDGGTSVTSFKAGAQSGDINYTLPSAAPSANGAYLVSTTGGVMSWMAPMVATEADDKTVTNTVTLSDADDLVFSLEANTNYWVEGFLSFVTGGDNRADTRVAFGYTGTLQSSGMNIAGSGTSVGSNKNSGYHFTSSGTSQVGNVDIDEDHVIILQGWVKTSTAGTLKVQFAVGTAGGGTYTNTLKAGSTLKLTKF